MTRNSLLTRGYRECARLTWRHGTTYFWGAALLPRRQRKHVYAVYALCRLADDIVDVPSTTSRPATGLRPDVERALSLSKGRSRRRSRASPIAFAPR